jgi:formyltetrahydrofolate deformylase
MLPDTYILTLTCADARGIVAAVAGFVTNQDGFIIESSQFGDASTGRFFARVEFAAGPGTPAEEAFREAFSRQVAIPFAMQWELHRKDRKQRVLILTSKFGHCLNDLLHRQHAGDLKVEIPAVVSNHPEMEEVTRWYQVPYHYLPVTPENKLAQEEALLALVKDLRIDLVVLARYMQILSPGLCAALQGRAINIHHSFLPSFKGARPYQQAFDRGVKLIGATAHYVTTDLDEGPIIEQEVARVDHTYSPADLTAAGRDLECLALSRAVKLHTQHRVLLNGTKTVVFR